MCFVLILVFCQLGFAQKNLPVIKATSRHVDIQDGDLFQENVWILSPEINPDTYYALKPLARKRIIFHTDIDSISFNIIPGNVYDFVVLLNSIDSCHTHISAIDPSPKTDLTKFFSVEKLKEDFKIFRESLQERHAGLYRYKNKKELDKVFDNCLAKIDHPMTLLEFGKTITYLISSIEDGHTGTNLPPLLMDYIGKNRKIFPAYVSFISNQAFVLCSEEKELPAGIEILSINNEPIQKIKEQLFRDLPSDGKITTKKQQVLGNGTFPFIYSWIYGEKDTFKLICKTKEGEIKTLDIISDSLSDFDCENRKSVDDTKYLEFRYVNNNVALLTIKTFDKRRLNSGQNFGEFLNSVFEKLNLLSINNLIIDLRGNAGEDAEYGALLYSYLTSKRFGYFSSKTSTKENVTYKKNPLLWLQKPQNNNYQGKAYFLIDGLSFSTTADFCAIAKSNNRGIFIGEETGGAYYGNTSGQIKKVQLSNTNIEIKIPKFKYVNSVKKTRYRDRGVISDYTIRQNTDDLLRHNDVQLNLAIKLAESGKELANQ